MAARPIRRLLVLATLVVGATSIPVTGSAGATRLIDPGPFAAEHVKLDDGRLLEIPAEIHALYRMLTQTGRLHGRHTAPPSDVDVRAGIDLRRRHEPQWTARFGDRPRTPPTAYVSPVEDGWLSGRSGYKPGHRAEDIFAAPGHRVFAPATMLVLHAGPMSKTSGETVVGFVPAGPAQPHTRYFLFLHVDTTPARGHVGHVIEAGTLVGYIATGDEQVVGSAHGRLPHVHFVVSEERPDGRLEGVRTWSVLRRLVSVAVHHMRHRIHR